MKTAQQIYDTLIDPTVRLLDSQRDIILAAMKVYASQAIDECAEVAEIECEPDYSGDNDYYSVNEQSILSVKTKLK